jgi:hypothetical protein
MRSGSIIVALCLLQQGLAFRNCSPRMIAFSTSMRPPHSRTNDKYSATNVRLNAAIPLRTVSVGTKIFSSTFAVRKQLSFITNAWKAAILVFVAIISRFKSKVSRTISTMEGGWKKRGYSGAFWRTVEVWRFVISFVFKYVSMIRQINPHEKYAL